MLKIKDNVDLKELEKYGFKYSDNICCYRKEIKIKINTINIESNTIDYFISIEDRIIEINTYNIDTQLDDTIYDLIKADLVEKVE